MKKNDIIIIVAVAIVAGILSLIIANLLFGGSKKFNLNAPIVQPVSSEFKSPDSQFFNKDSLDITKDITVEENSNNQPFSN